MAALQEYAESPLEGALLCCTSISPEDRAQLAEYAQEMGAKHTLDLTSDVTHLLVGNTDSKKYQYVAKEREDVRVLLPQWVHAIRNKWMADETIDLNAMDAEYKCPTLYGLKICITGFEDLDFRNELARNIAKHGGQYTGDLTKDVTHLIAFTPQGKKYEYAGTWGIKVVSLKWYKDTLDRGMQLDETLYHPAMPPEHQGRGAWNRQSPASSRLGKRQRTEPVAQEPSRKLRRAASARFGGQQSDMWNDIVGHPPSADADGASSKLRPTKSMSNVRQDTDLHTKPESDIKEPASVEAQVSAQTSNSNVQSHQEGFLTGKHFAQKGFDEPRKALLFAALSGLGATVHESVSELLKGVDDAHSRFLIVPHDIESKQFTTIQRTLRNSSIVTELWLEYCMTVKAFVPPESYALATPVCPTDIPGISKLIVNASGFHQLQTMHIAKIVKKLGATYQETFTPQTSVLVTNSSNLNQQKVVHATSWKVPIVTEKWLWKLIATNRIPSFDNFAVTRPNQGAKPNHSKPVEVQSNDQQSSSHQPVNKQNIESDGENTFVETANAIEAREKQMTLEKPKGMHKSAKARRHTDAEPHHTERNERQRSHNSPVPLQEVSANIMSKPPRSLKKKLFRQFDGPASDHVGAPETISGGHTTVKNIVQEAAPLLYDDQEELPPVLDDEPQIVPELSSASTSTEVRHSTNHDLLKEFFEVKAAAEARKSLTSSNDSKTKKKNLLGRAISNLSNSSRKSTEDNFSNNEAGRSKQPLSRASSINSLNTDGLGVPLSALSRIPSELQAKDTMNPYQPQRPALTSTAKTHLTRAATDSVLANPNPASTFNDTSFHAALATLSNSQLPQPPSPTQQAQLTYADTDEAAKLKAHLAEKRRTRARMGQGPTDPAPEMSREEQERRRLELAREESDEMRQARWRAEREGKSGALIKDDERVVGVGRRTRGREKRVSALGGGELDEGPGGGVFEGM